MRFLPPLFLENDEPTLRFCLLVLHPGLFVMSFPFFLFCHVAHILFSRCVTSLSSQNGSRFLKVERFHLEMSSPPLDKRSNECFFG